MVETVAMDTWSKDFSQRVGAWPVQEHLPEPSIPGEEALGVYVQKDFRVALLMSTSSSQMEVFLVVILCPFHC